MPDPLNIHAENPNRSSQEKGSIPQEIKSAQKGQTNGRTYSHPLPNNGQMSRISEVADAKRRRQKEPTDRLLTLKRGGLWRKMYEELRSQERERRTYCKIEAGEKALNPHEVEQQFLTFLDQSTPQKILSLTEQFGKEEVVKAANKAAFVQLAAENGNFSLVKFLIEELGCDPDIAFDGLSPLLSAAWKNHFEIVEFLLPRSSPASFHDNQPSKGGIIAYSAAGKGPNDALIRMLVERRDEFPIPISGCRSTAFYLLSLNRKKVSRWLQKKLKIPIEKEESSASLLAKVVVAANTYHMLALHRAVRKEDRFLVDLLIAAGACPDVVNRKGKTPVECAKDPLIKKRLKEAQEMQDSFRARQLEHLLKDRKSSKMNGEDQTFSWSNLIRTIESIPDAQQEFAELAFALRKSLALSFVIENRLIPKEEKRKFVKELISTLKEGEWVLFNDHSTHGHHKVNLVEKQIEGNWLCFQGDRYRNDSRASQISDTRRITSHLERAVSFCLEETEIYRWPDGKEHIPGKIKKKWQGAQDNCVTQSDTVALDYVLGEKLGKSKAALYRQLKPLRLHFLSSSLQRQGKPDFSKMILHWLKSPDHSRLSDLCTLIIPDDTYRGKHPSELLKDLDCFITSEDDGQLHLWQRGYDEPVQSAPWQEWQSLSAGIPREACDAGRRLRIQAIKSLTGEGTHFEFSVNDKHEGKLVCDLFNPPLNLHFQITETGVVVYNDQILMNTLASFWKKLPELLEREAKTRASTPGPQVIKNWLDRALASAYKRAFRNAYGAASGNRPPMGDSWRNNGALIEDFLQGKWSRGNTHTAIGLLGTAAPSLTESTPYRERLKEITKRATDEISKWTVPVKIGKKHAMRKKHAQVDSVALELPPRWQERLQGCFDDAWTNYLNRF